MFMWLFLPLQCMCADEQLLSVRCLSLWFTDRHRGLAAQTPGAEVAIAHALKSGALVHLEAQTLPILLATPHLVSVASHAPTTQALTTGVARGLVDFMRDRLAQRARVWGRRLTRGRRPWSPEEAASIDAAVAGVGLSTTEPLQDGIVEVDMSGRTVLEEFAAGRDDIAMGRLPFVVSAVAPVVANPPSPRSATFSGAGGGTSIADLAMPPRQPFTSVTKETARLALLRWQQALNTQVSCLRHGGLRVTALHTCVLNACPLKVVTAYLASGADPNASEATSRVSPLASALIYGDTEVG